MFGSVNRLTLDVVCDFQSNAGVVQCLSQPADVDLSAPRAVAGVTLRVALALRVALDVTRLTPISFLTPWSRRPRGSGDGATETVT